MSRLNVSIPRESEMIYAVKDTN